MEPKPFSATQLVERGGMIRSRRLGDQAIVSASIVSAVNADTGEPIDPGSLGLYTCDAGQPCGSGSSSGSPGSAAASPVVKSASTGGSGNVGLGLAPWGGITIPNPLANVAQTLLWIALGLGAVVLLAGGSKR